VKEELIPNYHVLGNVQKVAAAHDRYSVLLSSSATSTSAVDLPESIEALVEEARKKQYDMSTLLVQLKAMVCTSCCPPLTPTPVHSPANDFVLLMENHSPNLGRTFTPTFSVFQNKTLPLHSQAVSFDVNLGVHR
jgi:hypothetical protein